MVTLKEGVEVLKVKPPATRICKSQRGTISLKKKKFTLGLNHLK